MGWVTYACRAWVDDSGVRSDILNWQKVNAASFLGHERVVWMHLVIHPAVSGIHHVDTPGLEFGVDQTP